MSIDDDLEEVNKAMATWARTGWELVSGSSSSWYSKSAGSPTTWHIQYTLYWRRPHSG